ncbi:restriction endonuclease subunit S [Luteipulveratus sp. YIM 133132]|uniref:restriction endonuclease subunit S n=1 Tax=Luteipulveratus flavus TaxID=3031728 RepID=UPI0023B0CFD2|nr:restriction endonuclease subunit S [Luteipulveratus sp. YIM 133132]MDE9365686.1 restriction endonuclease subunit S [Luteipulveratus sp. YIM 133132]
MNWRNVPLAEVAAIQGGIQKQPKRAPAGNAYPFLRVANVTPVGLDLSDVHAIELFDGELEKYRLARGDLLVVEGNGSPAQIGRAALWDGSISETVHQNHLIRVRPGPMLDPKYLGYVWNSPDIRDGLSRVASSTSGLHTLSVTKLKRVVLPLPDLAEQRRIVEILEDHLSRLDAAADYASAATTRLSTLQEAALRRLLAGRVIERQPLKALLATGLTNGRSVPTLDGGFPVLRLTALKPAGVDLDERKGGAWTASDASRFLVAHGDYLIARGNGSIRLVGRGALVRNHPDPVAFPDTAIRVRPKQGALRADYLDLVWNSHEVRKQIEQSARTTAGIYKVNQKQLEAIELPVVDVDQQDEIVGRLSALRADAEALGTAIHAVAQRSTALRRAVLAAAFSGRLTGHRTDDEVIEELAHA